MSSDAESDEEVIIKREVIVHQDDEREVLKKGSQSLGLSRDHVPQWNSRDAFREFIQNW